ncbi:hypothetical protein Tco_1287708 [Tanacetum coccineum]
MQQPLPNNNFIPQPSFNTNYMQQPMPNPEDITDPTTVMNMALVLMAKAFKLNYSTPTNNNQRISSNPRNRHIAQPSMNLGQHRQMQMVRGNGGNQFRQYAGQNVKNLNRLGMLLIAQKEEAWIQLQPEEFDFMAAAGDLEEIEEVNANCILMANLWISGVSNVEQSGGTIEHHPATAEETHALYDSLYNSLATKVETINLVNRNLKETNAKWTTELARYKNQERYFEINQEKYDKLERCYQKSI